MGYFVIGYFTGKSSIIPLNKWGYPKNGWSNHGKLDEHGWFGGILTSGTPHMG